MTDFAFTPLVNDPPATILSTALGTGGANVFASETDVGKGVVLSTGQNYVLASTGDEIEGVVSSVEPWNVNDGFSFGAIQVDRRIEAEVADAEAGAIAIGTLVVCGIQIVLGTAGTLQVITGAPADHKWRVIRHVTGTGVSGDTVLLEKV